MSEQPEPGNCAEARRTGIALILHIKAQSEWVTIAPMVEAEGALHVAAHLVGLIHYFCGLIDNRHEVPQVFLGTGADTPARSRQTLRHGFELAVRAIGDPVQLRTAMTPEDHVNALAPLALVLDRLALQWTGQDETREFWHQVSAAGTPHAMHRYIMSAERAR